MNPPAIDKVPDVTFVVAAYNSADTIVRAIESALAQEGVTVEVVVVDDCSADATPALVAAIPDPRVRLIALDRNRGPGGARNAGIGAARGRWIAVLDSDDTVRPDRLRRMIERADAAGAQIAVDNLDVVSLDGRSLRMFSEAELARLPQLTLPAFIESNVLFRSEHNFGYMKPIFERRFLENQQLRFDEALRIGEDYILLASALACGGALRGRAVRRLHLSYPRGFHLACVEARSHRRDDRRRRGVPAPLRARRPGSENAAQAHARLPRSSLVPGPRRAVEKEIVGRRAQDRSGRPVCAPASQHADRCPIAPPCRAFRASLLPFGPPCRPRDGGG
nr:exoO [Sinorhizobium meliloti]